MTMADKIVVLSAGSIEQIGSPLELYHRPNNLFVAGFIGSPKMNFLKATASPAGDQIRVTLVGGVDILLPAGNARVSEGQSVTLGIRPEHIVADGKDGAILPAKLRLAEYLGSETMFYVSLGDGTDIAVKADGLATAHPGADFRIGIPPKACHLFDASGVAIINGDLTK
jgi:multiple sugar transport system ATP-binding protein